LCFESVVNIFVLKRKNKWEKKSCQTKQSRLLTYERRQIRLLSLNSLLSFLLKDKRKQKGIDNYRIHYLRLHGLITTQLVNIHLNKRKKSISHKLHNIDQLLWIQTTTFTNNIQMCKSIQMYMPWKNLEALNLLAANHSLWPLPSINRSAFYPTVNFKWTGCDQAVAGYQADQICFHH
jgi:hypothetical protein